MEKITKTVKETHKIAENLTRKICDNKNRGQVTVVALVGELGAGKTTFTQGFAKALGIKDKITSPTFVLLKRYLPASPAKRGGRGGNLIHIDAYRIDDPKELLDLGWEELINNPKNIILVEWADRIKKILPPDTRWVEFAHVSEKERKIIVSGKSKYKMTPYLENVIEQAEKDYKAGKNIDGPFTSAEEVDKYLHS